MMKYYLMGGKFKNSDSMYNLGYYYEQFNSIQFNP